MKAHDIYKQWLENPYFDSDFRQALEDIAKDPNEIEERFYKDLEFGTAGMRGIIGAGRNRMNPYVVRKASQGFANFLLKRYHESLSAAFEKAVLIAYDSRHFSKEFALETAAVMAGNGIKAYVFDDVRTTPELSFGVRHLHCIGGVMITASHNPPEYNGYKVYDETGCQLIPHLADALVEDVEAVTSFEMVKRLSERELEGSQWLSYVNEEVDRSYIEMVKRVSIRPELIGRARVKMVYTPLHGTGAKTITRTLSEMGYAHLVPVEEQMQPDGDFPTCKEPNPESVSAFEYGIKKAQQVDADLIVATDPDCDRIGLMVKHNGAYIALNGNQIGSLFLEYVLSSRQGLTRDHYVVNTVVSSDLAKAQTDHYGVSLKQTLTGFKFIGEHIEKDAEHFVMGYEESFGYLFAPHVRDKDAVMGTLIALEMAQYYSEKGMTLIDVMDSIYKRHGYFLEETVSKRFEGKEGQENMMALIQLLRTRAGDFFAYERCTDFLKDATGLPASDVLKFYVDSQSWLALRPSGTEPKLKVYFSIQGNDADDAAKKLEHYKGMILEKVLQK